MLGLLVLVGVCAFLGTVWIIARLTCVCRPSRAALAAGPAARERALRRAALAGATSSTDLESGSSFRSGTLDLAPRSDSMVTRASAWARAILAGEAPPPAAPPPSSSKAGSGWDPVSVPVKHAVVVVQPTGETFLGITSDAEERQVDVMIQVDELELLGISVAEAGALGRRQRSQRSQRSQREPAGAEAPAAGTATESAAEDDDGRSEDSADSVTARSSSGDLAEAESSPEEVTAAGEERGGHRRRRRRRRRRGTCEVACQTK